MLVNQQFSTIISSSNWLLVEPSNYCLQNSTVTLFVCQHIQLSSLLLDSTINSLTFASKMPPRSPQLCWFDMYIFMYTSIFFFHAFSISKSRENLPMWLIPPYSPAFLARFQYPFHRFKFCIQLKHWNTFTL
jgi:hypothetical protein